MAFKIADKIRKLMLVDNSRRIVEIVNDNKDFLADLLKRQLRAGLDGDDKPVTLNGNPFYQESTIKRKQKKKGLASVTKHVTNYDKGDFYKGIKPYSDGKRLSFLSTVEYYDDILERSGIIIMKLNKKHLKLFIRTKLQPQIKRRTS